MKKTLMVAVLFLAFFTFGCTTDVTTNNTNTTDDTYPATIRGRVLTDSGDMLTAGIIITYPNGDMERVNTNFLSGYTLLLYSGTYTLTYTRGYEYSTVTKTISVENYKTYIIEDVRLTKLFDVTDYGYYLGDLHQHSKYSDGADEVDQVLLSNLSNGLHFGFLSDHNSAGGLAEWTQGNRFVASYDNANQPIYFLAMRAVEITTDYGHFQSIGVGNVFEEADINSLKGDDPETEIIKMAQETIRSGAIAQINHPYAISTMGFNFWDITEEFETIEIWNGLYETNSNENLAAKLKWFELLDGYIAGENAFHAAT
ncbi:MAG TPA: CehA/McbA family metallohydrolase, partial [Bacillota bacterium]|nr:CehA/McbA family metallohydrolase [Bacillota bacterium]